jgi:tape measure domain-containing protein
MSNVDERIVEMTFKGQSFLAGIKSTLNALKSLKSGLSGLKSGSKDINQLDAAGKRFSLTGMSKGIDAVVHHFSLLRIAGLTVFTSLVRQGLFAGERLLSALTIDPIKAGLDVYETKINAIKTILANTAAEGTNLKQVTDALNQLNTYANLTVYNFGQMAKNIGTFTAAGVKLKTSVASIKGIANLAALSGSSAEQASTAMYQLSQAIATGVVRLQDWNSVVNAGLGGKVFQTALINTARVHGVAIDQMIKKDQGFRNTLQEGWLTSKILTETLTTFTGDLSLSQIKALGYTNKEAEAIFKQGQVAVKSATQIRTVTQLMQALKEEVATAWSHVFEAIIGNSNQATSTLSSLHNVAEAALTKPILALGKMLQAFTDLGGRAIVIKSITNVFHALGLVLSTVGAAFREVFPPSGKGAAVGLLNMAKALQRFTAALTPSKQTLSELKTIFAGVFSVIKIGIDVISALIGGLFQIGGAVGHAGGGFLAFVAVIAHWITDLRKAIESGTALQTFFSGLGKIIALPIHAIGAIIGALGGFGAAAGKAGSGVSEFIGKIRTAFAHFTDVIAQGISSGNFQKLAALVNSLLTGSILLAIRGFIKNLGKSSSKGLFSTIKESFEGLTKTLEVMQANLKSGILQRIAISVALLAGALLLLSLINTKNLIKALAGMTVLFIQLGFALKAVTGISEEAGIVKMAAVGVALNLLATAILILAVAVAILAQFSWDQLAKGLSAIAVLLGVLVGATALLSKNEGGLIASSIALNLIAIALNILALAVKKLGELDLQTLGKGIGSIAVLLLILAGFNAISGAQLIGTAAAMVILGAALNVIAQAVKTLGSLSVDTLAKGIVSIALALGIIAVAMNAMPPSMLVTAAALLIVSAALVVLSKALTNLGGMSWEAIAKSLITLAAALVIIAAAMILMTEALPGAAALLVVSASLAILAPILVTLGSLSWESIAKGLVALAGAFAIMGVAGLLLTPLVPTLLGLGIAITLFGIGILAAGAGVLAFATGLAALGVALAASGAGIASFVASILSILPTLAEKLGESVVAFAGAIGKGGAAITAAFVTLLSALLKGIIKVTPLITKAIDVILKSFLTIIRKNSGPIINTLGNLLVQMLNGMQKFLPRFVNKGTDLIIGLLNGIAKKVPAMAQSATNLIITFINAVANQGVRLANAGEQAVIHLINGVANSIRSHQGELDAAARNLGSAIISGLLGGISAGAGSIFSALESIASGALNAAKHFLGISSPSKEFAKVGEFVIQGLIVGMQSNAPALEETARSTGTAMLSALKTTLSQAIEGVDVNPRITPVVDLTEAKKGFADLATLSKSQLLLATGSTARATSISAANAAAAEQAGLLRSQPDVNLTFNQNNTSPEPLSASTIYRRTKNQLSIAKGALGKNANIG